MFTGQDEVDAHFTVSGLLGWWHEFPRIILLKINVFGEAN